MPSVVKCLICKAAITNPDFRVILCQEEYPDIDIGPFCEHCMGKIKICSGCQHPHLADTMTASGTGDFYCKTCSASLIKCKRCNTICNEDGLTAVEDDYEKVCRNCLSKHYFQCNCCNTYRAKEIEISSTSVKGMERPGILKKYKRICGECYDQRKGAFKKFEVRVCRHCGRPYSWKADMQDHYCNSCWGGFRVCDICGNKHPRVEGISYLRDGESSSRGVYACADCCNKMKQCSHCHSYGTNLKIAFIKGSIKSHSVCENCKNVKECKNCGGLYTDSGDDYCNACDRYLFLNKCSKCNRIQDRDGRCRVCHHMSIYSYSYKHHLLYNYDPKKESRRDSIFMGFENEVTFDGSEGERSARLQDLYGKYDCGVLSVKSDGSISGYGYEVVSQPMSLMYFHQMDLATLLPKTLKRSSSCGLHIHVGRDHFVSDVHLYKVINMLRSNKKFCEHAAGRRACGYATEISKEASSYIKDSKRGNTERRSMVNLTNKHTVEFRLFAGCVTEFELRSKFEFLHALITFCKEAPIKDSKSHERFIAWMGDKKLLYPNAVALFSKYTN